VHVHKFFFVSREVNQTLWQQDLECPAGNSAMKYKSWKW